MQKKLLNTFTNLPPRIIMLMTFASNSILNYIFGIAIGWLLIPGDYGLVGFSQTIILIAGILLNSGLAWSLTAQIAEAPEQNRMPLTRGALLANIALSIILMTIVVVLYSLGILRTGLETWTIVLVVVSSFPFLGIIAIVNGAVRGVEAFTSLASIKIAEILFKAFGGIFFIYVGWGAIGALLGFTLGGIIASLWGLWQTIRILNKPLWGIILFPSWRLTGDIFLAILGMALLLNLDIMFVKTFAGESRDLAGYYQSAIMLANTPYYMATALFGVLFPKLAKSPEIRKSLEPVLDTLRVILLFFIPIDIGLIIAPELVLGLVFPDKFLIAAPFMQILAFGNIFLILSALLSTTFQATQQARVPAIILMTITVLEGILLYRFVPEFQAIAASTIFTLTCVSTFIIQGIVYVYFVRDIQWQPLFSWIIRYTTTLIIAIFVYEFLYNFTHIFLLGVAVSAIVYLILGTIASIIILPKFISTRLEKAKG